MTKWDTLRIRLFLFLVAPAEAWIKFWGVVLDFDIQRAFVAEEGDD